MNIYTICSFIPFVGSELCRSKTGTYYDVVKIFGVVINMSKVFKLASQFQPAGDQPNAIAKLLEGIDAGLAHQTLLGVTGSGKTFTMANVIAKLNRPTMILAPNKTLAAQLYGEMREFFPENAVEYFVSYYD